MRKQNLHMNRQTQKGFTLVELLIAIAIIGLLSAFAIPAYQNYVKRAYIAEGLQLAAAAKSAITVHYVTSGGWYNGGNGPSAESSNALLGLAPPTDITGISVKSVHVEGLNDATGDGARVIITFNSRVADGGQIYLEAEQSGSHISLGSLKWKCGLINSSGMREQWLPPSCRGNAGYL